MQRLGKNTLVVETYVGENHRHLHRTPAGFQFGFDDSTQIITDISQVADFPDYVQEQVKNWLGDDGAQKATQARLETEIAEQASAAPGSLDALANQLDPSVKANLFSLLKQAIHARPSKAGEESSTQSGVKQVNGGVLVESKTGNKEFVPSINFGDLDDQEELIGVAAGVGYSESESDETMVAAVKAAKKRRPGRPPAS